MNGYAAYSPSTGGENSRLNPYLKMTSSLVAIGFVGFAIVIFVISRTTQELRQPARAGPHVDADVSPPMLPVDALRGTWRGTSYRDESGIFSASSPLALDENGRPSRARNNAADPTATIEFLFDIDDKYLAFKGAESCNVTMTYHAPDGQTFTSQGMFRIHLPRAPRPREVKPHERSEAAMRRGPKGLPRWQTEDRQNHIVFQGGAGELQVVTRGDGVLELQGEIRHIGEASILSQVRVKLQRDTDAPTNAAPDDAGPVVPD